MSNEEEEEEEHRMARNVDSNTSEHPFRISFPCDKKSNQAKRARRSQGRAKGDQMEVDIWKRRSPSVCLSEIPPDPLDLGRWGLAERNRVSSAFGNIVPMAFNVARKTLPRDGGVRCPSRWFQSGWGQEMKAKRLVSENHQLRVIIIELGGKREVENSPSIRSGRWEAKAFAETREWLLIFQQIRRVNSYIEEKIAE